MDHAQQVLGELNEWVWAQLRNDLADLEQPEIDWRPLAQANTINAIVRHLRIEAQWQLASLEDGQPMPAETTATVQAFVDSVPLDFARNFRELEVLCSRFIAALRTTSLSLLQDRNRLAYHDFPGEAPPAHFLGYHHATHLAMHWGQIRTIRNLYCTTRGLPARYFPDSPTFARPRAS